MNISLLHKISARRIFPLALALLLLVACGGNDEEVAAPSHVELLMADEVAVARGEAIFRGSCSTFCHTQTPSDTDALFLFDCEWKHGSSDEEMFDVVTTGIAGTRMVGYGRNFPEGDEDLWKVIAYIRSKQPDCS